MKFFSVFSVSCVISVLAFLSPASAQSKWTLTTADFRSAQVGLSSLDQNGATVTADGAQSTQPPPRVVKWDELLLLEREASAAPAAVARPPTTAPANPAGAAGVGAGAAGAGKFILYLAGGDQFRGEPTAMENETLTWNSPAVGAVGVPLKQVASIARWNQPPPPLAADARRSEDVVTLANGDSVHGILSGMAADGSLKMQSQGSEIPVPLESVLTVMLATTGASPAPAAMTGRAFRVRLADDSLVTASALRTSGSKLVLALAAGQRDVPLASVISIEQVNGPVSWLSSRRPVENVQTPLLDTTRPAKMDRTVAGKPIRFIDHTYARGIGVAPYSRLTWDLAAGGNYKAFRTQYAIDGIAPYADVTVRVKLDGKTVHERTGFTAGEISPVVLVPLAASKQLTLEVDFGGNYNVQDRLNWIEPALITATAIPSSPAPAPAKSPASTQSSQPAPAAQ